MKDGIRSDHEVQSSHKELLKIFGGMKGRAKFGETKQSRTKTYQKIF